MINTLLKAAWSSDWNGYEVGYPELDVVSLRSITFDLVDVDDGPEEKTMWFYYDDENSRILEAWFEEEE